jgi:hypothetical protein
VFGAARAAVNLSSGIYFMLLAASIISLRATRVGSAATAAPIRLVDIYFTHKPQSGDLCSLSQDKGSLKIKRLN